MEAVTGKTGNKYLDGMGEKCIFAKNIKDMNTITIDSNIYKEAETYANKHNLSIKQLVEKYLAQLPKITITKGEKYKLPKHLDNMGGCLSDIADPNDEKLNYLLNRYK